MIEVPNPAGSANEKWQPTRWGLDTKIDRLRQLLLKEKVDENLANSFAMAMANRMQYRVHERRELLEEFSRWANTHTHIFGSPVAPIQLVHTSFANDSSSSLVSIPFWANLQDGDMMYFFGALNAGGLPASQPTLTSSSISGWTRLSSVGGAGASNYSMFVYEKEADAETDWDFSLTEPATWACGIAVVRGPIPLQSQAISSNDDVPSLTPTNDSLMLLVSSIVEGSGVIDTYPSNVEFHHNEFITPSSELAAGTSLFQYPIGTEELTPGGTPVDLGPVAFDTFGRQRTTLIACMASP